MTHTKRYQRALRTTERLESALNGLPPQDDRRNKVGRLIWASWERMSKAEAALPVPPVSHDALAAEAARGWA